jgi:hypothetical protein
MQRK